MNREKGFTLVEIIVVMTIMGILTATGVVSYRQSLMDTRDQKRIINLQNIRSSLELFRSQNVNNVYPVALSEIESAGFVIPSDPLSGLANTYTYSPQPIEVGETCNNTTYYCRTYVLTTNLERLGTSYAVGPNSDVIHP